VAAILDLYSRKIVGWAMSERIDTALVLKALGMALLHRNPPRELLFHSDRGVQYASADYCRALNQAGLVASMSRRGNCYDRPGAALCFTHLRTLTDWTQLLDLRCQQCQRCQRRQLSQRLAVGCSNPNGMFGNCATRRIAS
jgi:transposase InsO family protein